MKPSKYRKAATAHRSGDWLVCKYEVLSDGPPLVVVYRDNVVYAVEGQILNSGDTKVADRLDGAGLNSVYVREVRSISRVWREPLTVVLVLPEYQDEVKRLLHLVQ